MLAEKLSLVVDEDPEEKRIAKEKKTAAVLKVEAAAMAGGEVDPNKP